MQVNEVQIGKHGSVTGAALRTSAPGRSLGRRA